MTKDNMPEQIKCACDCARQNPSVVAELERMREQLNLLAEETERRPSGAMWAIAQDLRRIAEGGE